MRNYWLVLQLLAVSLVCGQTGKLSTSLLLETDTTKIIKCYVKSPYRDFSKLQSLYHFKQLYKSGAIYAISCPISSIKKLAANGFISYAEFKPQHLQVCNDTMIKRNRILPLHTGESPLPASYSGNGVIYGMIDTGIDFNHPDFKDNTGNTRILYLWDQAVTNNSAAPQPYNYGREWTAADINSNLCTHNDLPFYGHGTHVAGIAAGNGLASGHNKGVAPNADIIAVALNLYSNVSLIGDAVNYIFSKAIVLGKPCVINISLGDYYGSHDGTDLETQAIEYEIVSQPGRAIVAAAGNAGSIRFHTKTQVQTGDTVFTWLNDNNNVINYWFYGDTAQTKFLKISVGANRTNFSDIGQTPFHDYYFALDTVKTDTLTVNGNRIGIIRTAAAVNPSGVHEYAVEITADTSNLLWRIVTTGQGLHHAWNFSFFANGLPLTAWVPQMVNYVRPDTLYSMVSGLQCSDQVITVANYQNLRYYKDVQDSLRDGGGQAGEISSGSSLGPTRDDRQKPDIAAGGQLIFSAGVLSTLPAMIANQPKDVAKDSLHVIGGGTSAASPIVAGIGVLYFEKNPQATHLQFKQALTACAYQDGFTGTGLPDYQWGYGKADGKNTLLCYENLVGLPALQSANSSVLPNPFTQQLNVLLTQADTGNYTLIASDGRVITKGNFEQNQITIAIPVSYPAGIYFLNITSAGSSTTHKLVKL